MVASAFPHTLASLGGSIDLLCASGGQQAFVSLSCDAACVSAKSSAGFDLGRKRAT